VLGIDGFGESAPASDLFKHFGFTLDKLVVQVKSVLQGRRRRHADRSWRASSWPECPVSI